MGVLVLGFASVLVTGLASSLVAGLLESLPAGLLLFVIFSWGGVVLAFGFSILGEGLVVFEAGEAFVDFFGAGLDADMERFGKDGASQYNSPIMGHRL